MVLQCKDKIDNKDKAIISRDENMNILSEKMHVSVSIFTNIYRSLCICVKLQNISYSYLWKNFFNLNHSNESQILDNVFIQKYINGQF